MINLHNVNFKYPNCQHAVLNNINLEINQGEIVLISGNSGCGKSTLLKCINGLVPHFSGGMLSGVINVAGHDPVKESLKELSQIVGFVFQDPENQFVMDQVDDEIAFVLENFALPRDEIKHRIEHILSVLNLSALQHRQICTLSGGEQQRVAIAAVLALQPSILVLDEPTSQLDPESAGAVLNLLNDLKEKLNLTVILSEHRLERVIPFCDRMIHLGEQGSVVAQGNPHQVLMQVNIETPLCVVAKKIAWDLIPLSVDEAHRYASQKGITSPSIVEESKDIHEKSEAMQITYKNKHGKRPFIKTENICFAYGHTPILSNINLQVYPGESLVLMGANGAGKSTLFRSIVGLLRPQHGSIFVDGELSNELPVARICRKIAYLPQDPNMMLFADRVEDELWITLKNHHIQNPLIQPRDLLKQLGIFSKADQYPRDLSTGERQRVALGAVLITKPGAVLLDEPTRGLDYIAKRNLIDLLKNLRNEGKAVFVITHDVEFAAQVADRAIIMDGGIIIKDGDARDIYSSTPPFMTQIAQAFPGKGWILSQDVIQDPSMGRNT